MNGAVAVSLAALVAILGVADAARGGPVLPTFSAADFSPGAPINNPYFPLTPGTRYTSAGTITDPETRDVTHEVDEDAVTGEKKTIAGVLATVVRARTWSDGVLIEDTRDYYAQDKAGNVWYLGEDTTEFAYDDNGNIVGRDTTGSWLTGAHGAKPGYIMPAHPAVGFSHYQEFSPADEAQDQALILSLTESKTVPAGQFAGVLKTREESVVEPGVIEFKYYAKGLGLILTEEDVDAGRPLNSVALENVTAAIIPLPPAVGATAVSGVVLAVPARQWALRRRRTA